MDLLQSSQICLRTASWISPSKNAKIVRNFFVAAVWCNTAQKKDILQYIYYSRNKAKCSNVYSLKKKKKYRTCMWQQHYFFLFSPCLLMRYGPLDMYSKMHQHTGFFFECNKFTSIFRYTNFAQYTVQVFWLLQ